jgi:hypothetical protein|tara:strand:+ start:279 stop:464 length:186 start_codon:yes stop_codon:yes gene_type:complete
MSNEEMKVQMETVSFFIDEMLSDFSRVDMSVKKADMLAHMEYWKSTLQTIKYMMKIDGIKR